MSDTLDGIEPPQQNQTESYLRAKEDIENNGLHVEAKVDTVITGLMDHANFLVMLRLFIKVADMRFGDNWMEILTDDLAK